MTDGKVKEKEEETMAETMNSKRLVRTMETYVPGESFEDYLELVENYFELNALSEDKFKVMLLINKLGTAASSRVIKAFKPKSYREETYENVLKMCKKLFVGSRSTLVERYKFNSRNQKRDETISDYAVELQSAAESCEFGTFLDSALRDRFVAGLCNTEIKQNLLKLDEKQTFTQFVDAALREALVVKEAKTMQVTEKTEKVNHVRREQSRGRSRQRSHSKKRRHEGANFDQRRSQSREQPDKKQEIQCYNCQSWGHFARDCKEKRYKMTNRGYARGGRGRRGGQASDQCHQISEDFSNLSLHDEMGNYQVNHVTFGDSFSTVAQVNGEFCDSLQQQGFREEFPPFAAHQV